MATRKGIDWNSESRLGVMNDTELALELGVTRQSVGCARRHRGIPPAPPLVPAIDWSTQPLGKVSDRALAKTLGLGQLVVRRARRKLGIAACLGSTSRKGILWDEQPLGRVRDVVLARELGVTPSTVTAARNRRGIPPFSRARKKETP